MLTFLLLSIVNTADSPQLGESNQYFFISGDYQSLVTGEDGQVFAASGFGLSVISPDLAEQRHIPTPGYAGLIVRAGKRLFLADGASIMEFELGRELPEFKRTQQVEVGIEAMETGGDYLAVAGEDADGARVIVYEITSRGLSFSGSFEVDDPVVDMGFYADYLYLASRHSGVTVLKLGAEPVIAGSVEGAGSTVSLACGSAKLFAATPYATVQVFSLRDPASPELERDFTSLAAAVNLRFHDKHLYAAHGSQGWAVYSVRGNRIEVAEPFRGGYVADVLPVEEGAYLALREAGVVFLSGSKPAELTLAARLEQEAPSIHLSRSGAFWAVARGRQGVDVMKLEDAGYVMGYVNPRPLYAAGVLLSGPNLYVGDKGRGVSIHSLKSFPSVDETYFVFQPGTPMRFALSQDLITLAAAERGLRVLWICPCGPLKQRASLSEGVNAADVATLGEVTYVADPDAGLRILNLVSVGEEETEVEEVGVYPGVISPRALLVSEPDSVLYVADSVGAVIALDVSDPQAPAQLSFNFTGSRPYGLAIDEDILYVACGEDGVAEIDVSDVSSPVILGFIDTPGRALAVAASARYIGVADYNSFTLIRRSGED